MAAQKGTQVIVATQSAELISNFEPEDVLTVNHVDLEGFKFKLVNIEQGFMRWFLVSKIAKDTDKKAADSDQNSEEKAK